MYFSLPQEYRQADAAELRDRIQSAKDRLGRKVVILAHHYQRMEIVSFGDYLGDSYALSKIAAAQKEAEVIIFCGVHFMAESADILTAAHQHVYLPNPLAGCPMADMADMADVTTAWEILAEHGGDDRIMPISYMNTAAGLKAFTGRHGGLICTSSNAVAAFEYALARREKVFFFPDENLGMNTALKMGLKPDEIVVWDFSRNEGGLTAQQVDRAKAILWKGHCHVHTNFKAEHIEQVRREHPGALIVVHPECIPEVVAGADASGSTKFIVEFVQAAPKGATIAIGTEINLIHRMAYEHPDKKIFELSGQTCPVCANMYRTTLNDLAFCLENYEDVRPIVVKEPLRSEAAVALEKMLEIAG
ncbi:MAG: quinolinate synthase NadA [bacterium]